VGWGEWLDMSAKPTPPQAILLRELSAGNAYAHADFDRRNKCRHAWGCYLASTPGQQFKEITAATFGALLKHGWIEKVDRKYVLSQAGREALAMLGGSDFDPERPSFTAGEIVEILRSRHTAPEWVFFDELRYGTGFGKDSEQRIDAWAMHTWPSKGYLKIAFEIKVYRSDFLKELADPYKRKPALNVSNRFYFVGPRGLMTKYEMPEECGLMEISPDGTVKIAKEAPDRKAEAPSWRFLASLARRMQGYIEK